MVSFFFFQTEALSTFAARIRNDRALPVLTEPEVPDQPATQFEISVRGEAATLVLHKHHPELVDAWGDLEATIVVNIPIEALQPAGLKLTLLPFQREGLYWMQAQERGIWRGGVLAVSLFFFLIVALRGTWC